MIQFLRLYHDYFFYNLTTLRGMNYYGNQIIKTIQTRKLHIDIYTYSLNDRSIVQG